MQVLVTGHEGYIGTILTPMLMAEGHDVVGVDTNLFATCTLGEDAPSISSICKDIRDLEVSDLHGFDAVVHLAALSNDPLGDLNPAITYAINHHATVHVAKLAKAAGVVRFVFSSSCSTYGAAGDDFLDEGAALHPVTAYGHAKVLAEQELATLADETFSPTFLRNATAYGVSPRLRTDLVLNDLVAWAYTTGEVLLKSDGTPWRPLVHIEDISRAVIAVLLAPRETVHNQVFNIGRQVENYRVRELAEIVTDVVPGSRLAYAADAGPDKRCYRVDFGKVTRLLPAFKPQWDARRGAEQLYQAYQQAGLTWEVFNGPRYKRIGHIQRLLKAGQLESTFRWTQQATASSIKELWRNNISI
jgi:nucleoside-diphosphate-sugar epimerase